MWIDNRDFIDFEIDKLYINLYNKDKYLPILHKFTQLQCLECSDCNLKVLPELPDTLQYLYCSNNCLTKISSLPESLIHLDCSNNLIDMLPPILPSKLSVLNCTNNRLHVLPTLPDSLTILACSYNCRLKSLPVLPDLLVGLNCNYIVDIPMLPYSLKYSSITFKNSIPYVSRILHPHIDVSSIDKINSYVVKTNHSIFIDEFMQTRHTILMSPSRISRLLDSGQLELDNPTGWNDL